MKESQLKLNALGGIPKRERRPVPLSEIDHLLMAQIAIGWAGEKAERPRLGWWRSDFVSEFGGKDLFQRLLPNTWEWAAFQSARETARRHDSMLRAQAHNPDSIVSIYNFGFEIDERVEERLLEFKRSGKLPYEVLPALEQLVSDKWNEASFVEWVQAHGASEFTASPTGRWIKGKLPEGFDQTVNLLVASLLPLSKDYPLPHFRVSP